MPGIGIISNPKSRQNRKRPETMRRLAYLLGSQGEATETQSLDDLYRALEHFKAAQIDILGVNGGDGSLHVTLTALVKVYQNAPLPKLAILRGGTLNTIATGLGIQGNPSQITYDVAEKYHTREAFETKILHLLEVEGRYGFIFGNGIIANFLEVYYGTGHPTPATAARLVARGIGSVVTRGELARRLFARVHATLVVDGETWAVNDLLALAIATVPQIGLGFTPWYRYDADPEKIQVLAVHCSPVAFAGELPNVFAGRPMRRDHVIDQLARVVELHGEKLPPYTLDGDLYTPASSPLVIRRGPPIEVILR